LGTRANIDECSHEHRWHSVLLAEHGKRRVVIDCGRDWLGRLKQLQADAIVVTHAHPDHVFGLSRGASCPVYATRATWDRIEHYPINDRKRLSIGKSVDICGLRFEAFAVEHSIRAPAVGFRLSDGRATVFYCPDLARIRRCHAAMMGITAYLGDGAAISRDIFRKRHGAWIGHASIRTQLAWCRREGVERAIFTHCGTAIVGINALATRALANQLSLEFGLHVAIACDGMRFRAQRPSH
jgi:phosphoribosyl 1,2-cyclic phosphodiesterase